VGCDVGDGDEVDGGDGNGCKFEDGEGEFRDVHCGVLSGERECG